MVTVTIDIGTLHRVVHVEYDHLLDMNEAESQLPHIINTVYYVPGYWIDYLGAWEWAIMVDDRRVGKVKWECK